MSKFGLFRFIALLAMGLTLSQFARAAEYEQKRGPAILQLAGDKFEDGRIEMRLSNKLYVIISVEGPATLEVEKPAAITHSKSWLVRQTSELERVALPNGGSRWRWTETVEPETKGDLPLLITPLRYRLEEGKGEWQTAKWDETTIRVTTTVVNADPSQARDITPPEDVPEAKSPWATVLRWAGIALIGLSLVLGALELKRRLAPPKPALAPHEWAARELARLEALGLPRHGQAERFHTLVSDTIRRYLELRYQLRAPRQTTAEFLDVMRQSPHLNPEQRNLLRDFLERCDLAKFARAEYSAPECQATATMARSFVDQTKPQPPPSPAAAAPAR